MDTLQQFFTTCDCEVRYAEPLARYTTFHIGGVASALVLPRTKKALVQAIAHAEAHDIRYRVVGGMSNLLCSDAGFRGLVISTRRLSSCRIDGVRMHCGCGATLAAVAHKAMGAGLSGMEPLCGIPGTIGGALVMNAGAYGREIGTLVASSYCYHPKTGEYATLTHGEHGFAYRHSDLVQKGLICLSAELVLLPEESSVIGERMAELRQRRMEQQPTYPSAGSAFRRPEPMVSAGKLIAEQGLAGLQIGGARISERHAGFIVNTGGATAADVLNLMRIAKERVRETTGYVLEAEIEYLSPET